MIKPLEEAGKRMIEDDEMVMGEKEERRRSERKRERLSSGFSTADGQPPERKKTLKK